MPIETIHFDGTDYPAIQAKGFAAEFAFPFAKKFLTEGLIYDIGFGRKEWLFPGALGVDINNGDGFDAYNLPPLQADGIFSSHCLEHLPNYVEALELWNRKLKYRGILFLYLPNCDYQRYWAPTSNKKHIHHMTPQLMKKYFEGTKDIWEKVTVGEGYDLNGSFYVLAQKKG